MRLSWDNDMEKDMDILILIFGSVIADKEKKFLENY